ncbi:cation diffusion facilitator family transporter [Ruminococcaceae bacterium OttesenSCG-928-D13]|nr:cation diffusion facilitator family transporter [Ruminococcaceae bacterium OttesenSCG-928-D13]
MTNLLVRLLVKDYKNLQSPAVRARYGQMAGLVGIVCNLLLAAGKLAAGLLSGSLAITADAVNNLSDAASSIITLVGFKLSARPADEGHPFGHARFEYIAGLAVAVLVLVVGVELGKSSIEKIANPAPVVYGNLALLVLAASILVKVWMANFNRSIGRRIGSTALEATFADSRNDVITTTAVLAAALVARATGFSLDGWMGAAVAVFIIVSGIGLVKDTLDPLLGAAPDPALVKAIEERIDGYPGVLGTHDLMVHDYGPNRRFASAHVEMDADADVLDSHEVIDRIERDFLEQDNIHLIIHYDPVAPDDSVVGEARQALEAYLKTLDGRITIHDFRMVDGKKHVNYIFDVRVPPDFAMTPEELRADVEKSVKHDGRRVHVHLTVDYSYMAVSN